MAGSKNRIKSAKPRSHDIRQSSFPETVYLQRPTWIFSRADQSGRWAFTKENIGDAVWSKILPFLRNIESQTWEEILIGANKQNHTIPIEKLNKCARDRMDELKLDCDEVISLRLGGNLRLYGVWQLAACAILWYDNDHGDNNTCVCRSRLKHT